MTLKICGIALLFIFLIGITACSAKTETTPVVTTTTTISSSTAITTINSSTRPFTEILAAANAEVASVKIANQAYAAEHEGKYASNSSQLTKYLKGTLDATYYFNANSGAITKAVNGEGITEAFLWDSATQMWRR